MLAVLGALGLVGGIVWLGATRTVEKSIKSNLEKQKLVKLTKKKKLSLDEAEDGVVLARRFKNSKLASQFEKEAVVLRKNRAPV